MAKTSHELAIEFAVEITELCSRIKGRREYTKQLIRSASSISANIRSPLVFIARQNMLRATPILFISLK